MRLVPMSSCVCRCMSSCAYCTGAAQGICASPDGVALPVGPTVPVPTAYFPLTNGSTSSWPIPEYWAYNTSAVKSKQSQFVTDSFFGTVVQCNATAGGSCRIPISALTSAEHVCDHMWTRITNSKLCSAISTLSTCNNRHNSICQGG